MYILPGALAPLAAYRQFILVQFVPRLNAPGKTDKHPTNPVTLLRHDAHDPAIWLTVGEAAALANQLGVGYGVGFVITASDPIVCMDMDECATLDGGWTPEAMQMLVAFPGAVELSNSGRGLHVWNLYSGMAPEHAKKSKGTLTKKWLELYTELRFIALGSSCSGAMTDVTTTLPGFIAQWFPPHAAGDDDIDGWTVAPVPEYGHLDDERLIAMAMSKPRRQNAEAVFAGAAPLPSFADLWNRDISVLSRCFPPQMPGKEIDGSDADFALAKELAYWTGKNCERVATLMRKSAMYRDKWEPNVHKTYFTDTVINGVNACQAVYQVKVLAAPPVIAGMVAPKIIEHQTFVNRENLMSLFDGCCYIQDLNQVLIPNGDIVDAARFKARYAGYTFSMDNRNEKVSKDAWDAFINNSIIQFPRVEGTAFDPRLPFQGVIERGGRSWINTYKAPTIERIQGDVGPFMALLNKLLPNGDDAIILLSYMAAVVQNPGIKFRWAPFIQGTRGNGKSTLINCLKHALGNKYIFSIKAGMIENNFNGWLENNVLYVADDIYSTRDRTDMMEALKALISERDHGITYKGIDSIQKAICGNFIFTDNHKDAMRKQDDSRGICTLYCAQQSKYDRKRDGLTKDYFVKTLYPWLNAGGFAAVSHMLATMEIDPRYDPSDECQEAPDTSMTQEAIADGRTNLEHEIAEWIELQEPGFCGDFVSVVMLKKKMESNPRYAKSSNPLKIKEMMGRLGYELHRGIPDGRVPSVVQPDDTRPILYVKRDSWQAELKDAELVGLMYTKAQQDAMAAIVERRFNHVSASS